MASSKDRSTRCAELPDFDLVLFGGTGDLAMRKLLPALYRRYLAGQFPAHARIVGVARSSIERDDYLAQVEESSKKYLPAGPRRDALDRLQPQPRLPRAWTPPMPPTYQKLAAKLASNPAAVRVFFLSTAPALFATICTNLAAAAARDARSARGAGEAAGPGPRLGRRHQSEGRRDLPENADLPHRSLPRQGDGAEPDGAALRQRAVRAAVAPRPHQPRADHGGRAARRRGARRVLRPDRRAARHGAEPPAAAAVHHGDGAAGIESTPTRCATRSSRCCAR